MKQFRRGVFISNLLLLIVAVFVLSNVWVQNPTGRYYSSEIVDLDLNSHQKGIQGEEILAQDLGVPLWNDRSAENTQCICSKAFEVTDTVPRNSTCNMCVHYADAVPNDHLIPDFITGRFIADAKNVQDLSRTYTSTLTQITNYSAVANELNLPLWIYVRENTVVDQQYYDLVRSTGGNIIRYFQVDNSVHPIEGIAWNVLLVTVFMVVIIGVWEYLLYRRRSWLANRPTLPEPDEPTPDAVKKAMRATDDTEDWMQHAERWSIHVIDNEDDNKE